MFRFDVVYTHREVTISAAMRVGLCLPMVHGQLHFEVVFVVAQVDEGEGIEGEARRHLQAEGVPVELDGALLVHDADHRVNQFGHDWFLCRVLLNGRPGEQGGVLGLCVRYQLGACGFGEGLVFHPRKHGHHGGSLASIEG